MVHLVYCDNTGKSGKRVLDKIMSGEKTMVIRSAAGRKIPHSRVFENGTLYFMEKGSMNITAKATVCSVQNFIKLNDEEITEVIEKNQPYLALTEKQKLRWHKKCICLAEFNNVQSLSPSLEFEKQNNMDDWLIIEKIEDVCVGTSIPYNYENSKL